MAHLNFLEQFDNAESPGPTPQSLENLPGYDAGYRAGFDAASQAQTALSSMIVDRLVDVRFGMAEAHQAILETLRPFVHALCDQILPDIIEDVTRSKLVETLLLAAQQDIAQPLTLTVHPTQEVAMAHFLSETPDFDIRLHCDPSLEIHEVLIGTESQETQLDVPGMLDKMRNALATIVSPAERTAANG